MTTNTNDELINLVCKKLIATGSTRRVFQCFDESLVVKVEIHDHVFANISELLLYNGLNGTPHIKWLAPIVDISENGKFMFMKKTEPLPDDKAVWMLPEFLADLKRENFGLYEGKIVAHDYANHFCFTSALLNSKLHKVTLV